MAPDSLPVADREGSQNLDAAASIGSNDGGGCGYDNGGRDVILAGPLTGSTAPSRTAPRLGPSSGSGLLVPATRLHMHKGDLFASCPWCPPHSFSEVIVANDAGDIRADAVTVLLRGSTCGEHSARLGSALTAARQARFDHGQAPQPPLR